MGAGVLSSLLSTCPDVCFPSSFACDFSYSSIISSSLSSLPISSLLPCKIILSVRRTRQQAPVFPQQDLPIWSCLFSY